MGNFIVIEGIDGSGKSTQFRKLRAHVAALNQPHMSLAFPRYDNPSSTLLRLYLAGEFGTDPNAVNPYAASTFYAMDRFASFKQKWESAYQAGQMVLADRYTTSNAIHQGAKLTGEERLAFFRWLDEFEHEKLDLPRPDIVLYMDVPIEIALENICIRSAKTAARTDIHEQGVSYLTICAETGRQAANFFGWRIIHCTENGKMRPQDEIHQEILSAVRLG